MITKNALTKNMAKATLWLVIFQVVGLVIPLLTLPILARSLGVTSFGQLMLAQAVVFLGVVFVDAGFNTESQRRASLVVGVDSLESQQVLIDNFIARCLCSLPILLFVLIIGFFVPDLPFVLVVLSLLLIIGTLIFPQWWYVARHQGLRMGIALVSGRLISALVILLFVKSTNDQIIACVASCSGTLIAGLLLMPNWWQNFKIHRHNIKWNSWKRYLNDVKHNIFSGFFSSASVSVPVLALGFLSGSFQAGLFAAADRLTRAFAHVLSFVEQSCMGWLAKENHKDLDRADQLRVYILAILAGILLIGCGSLAILAEWILHLLYGNSFVSASLILKILSIWLFIYGLRKAAATFYWSSSGNLKVIAILQWSEAVLVSLLASFGAYWSGAVGTSVGLCISELILSIATIVWIKRGTR
jgi:polysaccharide transporter, PST family